MEAGHVTCIHQLPVSLQQSRRCSSELIDKGQGWGGVMKRITYNFFMAAMPWCTSSTFLGFLSLVYTEKSQTLKPTLLKIKGEWNQWSQSVDVVFHSSLTETQIRCRWRGKNHSGSQFWAVQPLQQSSIIPPLSQWVRDKDYYVSLLDRANPDDGEDLRVLGAFRWILGAFSGSIAGFKHNLWKNKSISKKNVSWRLGFLQCLQLLGKMFLAPCRW